MNSLHNPYVLPPGKNAEEVFSETAGLLPPCPLTGKPHRTYELNGAVWCHECRQKLRGCCEGDCP